MSGELRSHTLRRLTSWRGSLGRRDPSCTRPLFGGAIQADLPRRFANVADYRPVPDNREVFADADRDQSIIFEIAAHQGDVPDDIAAEFFWNESARQNKSCGPFEVDASRLDRNEMQGMPPELFKGVAEGEQWVAGRGGKGHGRLQVFVAVVRLPSVRGDLVVTLSTPLDGGLGRWGSLPRRTSSGLAYRTSSGGSGASSEGLRRWASGAATEAPLMFKGLLASMKINNWGLFGE